MADDRSGPPAARRTLATRLRWARLDADLGQVQMSEATGISQGKISKVERGDQPIRVDHVDAWARACGLSDYERSRLLDLAESALTETSTSRAEHRAGLTAKQNRVAGIEARATRLREFAPAMVPGLLQTYDYARSIIAASDVSAQRDVDTATQARVARQHILDDPGKTVEFLVTEAALAWHPSGGQRDHLAAAARRPDLRLGVIPTDAEPAWPAVNPFRICEFADGTDPVVVVETFVAEISHDDPRDVATHVEIFQALADRALFGEQAAAFLLNLPGE